MLSSVRLHWAEAVAGLIRVARRVEEIAAHNVLLGCKARTYMGTAGGLHILRYTREEGPKC